MTDASWVKKHMDEGSEVGGEGVTERMDVDTEASKGDSHVDART